MKRLILISGDLASGKSSLADSLSLYLNVPCLKKDDIKEKYCDMYGFKNREENRALSVKAVNYMIEAFENFAKLGQQLILEANFREEELIKIRDIVAKYNYDVHFYVLRGDIDVLYQRFLDRLPTRHKAHKSMHLEESKEKFEQYILEQRRGKTFFIPFIIDTTDRSEKEVFELVISGINK